MHVLRRVQSINRASGLGPVVLAALILGVSSCSSQHHPTRPGQANLDPGWPKGSELWHQTPTPVVPTGWPQGEEPLPSPLYVPLPQIPGANVVDTDEFCRTCHETYMGAFANNVHRDVGCESCHGGAGLHLEALGQRPNTILSFKTPEAGTVAGMLISPVEQSEICLQCHDNGKTGQVAPCVLRWRTSVHAQKEVTCTDCHRAHYLIPPGTPSVEDTVRADPRRRGGAVWVGHNEGLPIEPSPRGKSHSLAAVSPDVCYRCHAEMVSLERVVHPHQLGVPFDYQCTTCHDPPPRGLPHFVEGHPGQFNCTTCHDPHGNVRPQTRKDLCLKCHGGAHMNQWHSSPHNSSGIACTDCHNPHPQTGPPMAVDQPGTCYRCHGEKQDLERIAHAHQVLGPNRFNCSTCHDPHGKISAATRRDLCLKCHDGAPTMAWHSSTHNRHGVACTDCHNPHPRAQLPQVVNVSHTTVRRPGRLPMSVGEPQACYKCHQKIYGLTALPSHHPIAEGKMVCSDCHDAHGQARRQLKEDSVNEVCCECHAEKEGPFAYPHKPVTENCGYCHNPHGSVANNLLHQPTTFLCLRCHSGHSTHGRSEQCFRCHFVGPDVTNVGGGPLDDMHATTATTRRALFTDCTQCHAQVHGSDLPNGMACLNRLTR